MTQTPTNAGETWRKLDYPVLLAAAHLCDESAFGHAASHQIASRTGFSVEDVVKAIGRLRERYLLAEDVSSLASRDLFVTGLTEAGLVAAEVWPSAETVAERLITALEALLDETPEGSPKRSRITGALVALKDLSVGTGGNVLGQAISGAFGLI